MRSLFKIQRKNILNLINRGNGNNLSNQTFTYKVSFPRAASSVLFGSLFKNRRTPIVKLIKYSSHSSVRMSMLNLILSFGAMDSINFIVLLLWNFHSVKMNFCNKFSEFQTFLCKRTRIGRPPDIFVIVSRMYAGMKWTKMAEILNSNRLDMNFKCGYLEDRNMRTYSKGEEYSKYFVRAYQTADFNGYLCR